VPVDPGYIAEGLSDIAIVAVLNAEGIKTRRGAMEDGHDIPKHPNAIWHETSVRRRRARLAL
jgi:hypothetical protein